MSTTRLSSRTILVLMALLGMIAAMLAIAPAEEAQAFPGANGKIAFQRDGDIWIMNADGTGPSMVRDEGIAPAVSADGQQIAFAETSGGDFDIWTMSVAGSGATQVSIGGNDYAPGWSPDGEWLTFYRREVLTSPGAGTATMLDATGTILVDTAPNPFASVRPGMTVTNSRTGAKGTVLSVNVGTATLTTTALAGGSGTGWLVGDPYTLGAKGNRIYKIKADGTGEVKLSTAGLTDYYSDDDPVWSPNGLKIAYSTDRNGNDDIYVMGSGGEGAAAPTNLTADFDDVSWDAAWSPSGAKIAFTSGESVANPSGDENLWTMNADGTGKAIITDIATAKDEGATWSPDGASIAFERLVGADEAIFVVPFDAATPPVRLSAAAPTVHSLPDWQPILGGMADAYGVAEGAVLTVPVGTGVLANDLLFATAVTPAATAINSTTPANGTLSFQPNGSFVYSHDGTNTTSDSFTYQPSQGGVLGTATTVTITITPTVDAPVAVNDGPYLVTSGGTLSKAAPGVLANDTPGDGTTLTAVEPSTPAHGSVTLSADGSFVYTHNGDSATSDSFTYKAKNNLGVDSNVATVTITLGAALSPIHEVGLVDPLSGQWYLFDDAGVLTSQFYFGNPGDYPFMGDWDGDGVETPGLYRQSDGYVYLRDSNSQGVADIKFFFGDPGDVPVAGDFNNDGFDTVSIYRPSNQTFYIINKLGSNDGGLGAAEFSYVFGNPGDKPFVGDFDGDGVETVGLHRESTGLVYFRNSHTQGNADAQFIFGDPGDRLIAGDWTGDGVFTPALFRPSNTTMYFRYTNSQGNADNQYVPTPTNPAWLPVSGELG